METENKYDNNNLINSLETDLETRIKKIVDRLINKEDPNLKKRNVKKLLSFIITLKEDGAISPLCISSINFDLLQDDDTYKILCELFIDAAKRWEIRNYIMLIDEFRIYFPDIDFIYESYEIQSALIEDIELLETNRQNTSTLSKYLKK